MHERSAHTNTQTHTHTHKHTQTYTNTHTHSATHTRKTTQKTTSNPRINKSQYFSPCEIQELNKRCRSKPNSRPGNRLANTATENHLQQCHKHITTRSSHVGEPPPVPLQPGKETRAKAVPPHPLSHLRTHIPAKPNTPTVFERQPRYTGIKPQKPAKHSQTHIALTQSSTSSQKTKALNGQPATAESKPLRGHAFKTHQETKQTTNTNKKGKQDTKQATNQSSKQIRKNPTKRPFNQTTQRPTQCQATEQRKHQPNNKQTNHAIRQPAKTAPPPPSPHPLPHPPPKNKTKNATTQDVTNTTRTHAPTNQASHTANNQAYARITKHGSHTVTHQSSQSELETRPSITGKQH